MTDPQASYAGPKRNESSNDQELPKLRPLMEFADIPLNSNDILLGNRFLCRHGTMLFIGPSGIGKSAASAQQDILWSVGAPAFGIKPSKPLRILTIQAEDDDGDLCEIVSGIKSHLRLSEKEIALCRSNCLYVNEKSHTGILFLQNILRPLVGNFNPDIIRINPLQAFLGGDIKDSMTTSLFLRNCLNQILVDHNCAAIIVHHTPKTNLRDTTNWRVSSDWMYAGAGSADITNHARAILVIDATDNSQIFAFIGAKRGSRTGWANYDGESTFVRYFAHSGSDSIFWREAEQNEIPEISHGKNGKFQTKFSEEDILALMSAIEPLSTNVIRQCASNELGVSKATFFRIWTRLKNTGKISNAHGKWIRS